jgi:hypothetical protein
LFWIPMVFRFEFRPRRLLSWGFSCFTSVIPDSCTLKYVITVSFPVLSMQHIYDCTDFQVLKEIFIVPPILKVQQTPYRHLYEVSNGTALTS